MISRPIDLAKIAAAWTVSVSLCAICLLSKSLALLIQLQVRYRKRTLTGPMYVRYLFTRTRRLVPDVTTQEPFLVTLFNAWPDRGLELWMSPKRNQSFMPPARLGYPRHLILHLPFSRVVSNLTHNAHVQAGIASYW